jgi:hypothetical protein
MGDVELHLSLLRRATASTILAHLHNPIEQEIAASSQRVKNAKDEYRGEVEIEECALIDELLGMAFVAAQIFITGVRTIVEDLSRACSANGRPLPLVKDPKAKASWVLDIGEQVAGSTYTAIQVAYHVANYWKHRDEWETCEKVTGERFSRVWKTDNKNDKTVRILSSIGIEYSTGPLPGHLRTAAEAFGVTDDYADLSPVRQKVRHWAEALYKAVVNALEGGDSAT